MGNWNRGNMLYYSKGVISLNNTIRNVEITNGRYLNFECFFGRRKVETGWLQIDRDKKERRERKIRWALLDKEREKKLGMR